MYCHFYFCIFIHQGGVGAASGGPLSEHERTSCLEALDSTLRGLEEVLSKRTLIDRAARREADALGGPAMISSLMDGADASRFASEVEVEAEVGEDVSSKGENPIEKTPEKEQDEAHTGWLSGAQLRAFAKQIQTKCVLVVKERHGCVLHRVPKTFDFDLRSELMLSFPPTLESTLLGGMAAEKRATSSVYSLVPSFSIDV